MHSMKPSRIEMLLAALLFCAIGTSSRAGSILLDGDFDSLPIGTAPSVGVPAGHWTFPADYVSGFVGETNVSEFTTAFAPGGANGNCLHLSADTILAGNQHLPNIFTQSANKGAGLFLIASFDIYVSSGRGGGGVYLGNGLLNSAGRGPQIGWDSNGYLYYAATMPELQTSV